MFAPLIHNESWAQAVNSGRNLRSHDGSSGSIPIANLCRFPISIVIQVSLSTFGIPAG